MGDTAAQISPWLLWPLEKKPPHLGHRFQSQPTPQPPPVSPTTYPDPCRPLEPLPIELLSVTRTIDLNPCGPLEATSTTRPSVRVFPSGNDTILVNTTGSSIEIFAWLFLAPFQPPPTDHPLPSFGHAHINRATLPPSPPFPSKPRSTDQTPSNRRAHRSHDLLTSLLVLVSTPCTETTAYRPQPTPFHHDVASAYIHLLSTPCTALTQTSANLDYADYPGIKAVPVAKSLQDGPSTPSETPSPPFHCIPRRRRSFGDNSRSPRHRSRHHPPLSPPISATLTIWEQQTPPS